MLDNRSFCSSRVAHAFAIGIENVTNMFANGERADLRAIVIMETLLAVKLGIVY